MSSFLCVFPIILPILTTPHLIPFHNFTERSTTRLHAPPGGKSSFSLAHDEGPGAAPVKRVEPKPSQIFTQQENAAPQPSSFKPSNSGNMAAALNQVVEPPVARRARPPPGGVSTFTLG